jgi:hypothetical protein
MTALCSPWATPDDVVACGDSGIDVYADQEQLDHFLQVASELLFQLSGQQFSGECEATLRPCSRRCGSEWTYRPTYRFGQTAGLPWPGCSCEGTSREWCSCKRIHQIELGVYPLIAISEVLVDGDIVPDDEYRIDANRWLVRLPDVSGFNPGWPICQDLNLDSTEPDTFEVTFTYGRLPPASGVLAAANLAKEFFLACSPSTAGACRLPKNISSISRQGVSVIFERLTRVSGNFRFGLWEIDTFLEAYAPYGPHPASVIMSPDTLPAARRVGT